jgi:hypothetical protein
MPLSLQILFSLRVLVLRLSLNTLNDVFRKIWPTLITLIMGIFAKAKESKGNLKVMLEALKLLELISIKNIEEFYLYQWIFIYDCSPASNLDFGMSFELNDSKHHLPSTSAFTFNPGLGKLLPYDTHTQYRQNCQYEIDDIKKQEDHTMLVRHRHIIIRESTVDYHNAGGH